MFVMIRFAFTVYISDEHFVTPNKSHVTHRLLRTIYTVGDVGCVVVTGFDGTVVVHYCDVRLGDVDISPVGVILDVFRSYGLDTLLDLCGIIPGFIAGYVPNCIWCLAVRNFTKRGVSKRGVFYCICSVHIFSPVQAVGQIFHS